jgi:hypothetical protein
MPKYRVTYVAVQHELTVRSLEGGVTETLDDRIAYYKQESVSLQAANEEEAREMVKRDLPPNVEFTAQVTKLP